MYHSLKETAQLCGLNERTVIRYMQQYMQSTDALHVAPTKEERSWRFSDEDVAAIQHIKAEHATRRTAAVHVAAGSMHAGYMQATDAETIAVMTGILTRLEAVEEQVRVLTRRVEALALLRTYHRS